MANSDRPRAERRREHKARHRQGDQSRYRVFSLAVGLLARHRRMVRALLIYTGCLLGLLFLSKMSPTMDIYSHVVPSMQKDAVKRFAMAFETSK